MAITEKRPAIKETVGSQYICFAAASESGDGAFAGTYEENVEKTSVVKSVKVKTNGDSTDVWSSGAVYDVDDTYASKDIEVEVIAFPADTIAKMKGDTVGTNGLITSGGGGEKPFFAYGKVVKKKHGKVRYEWFPKCKLVEVSDEISTKEEKFAEQTDTVTIRAYAFNDSGDFSASVDSDSKVFPSGLTEEKFFTKPILTDEELKKAAEATT